MEEHFLSPIIITGGVFCIAAWMIIMYHVGTRVVEKASVEIRHLHYRLTHKKEEPTKQSPSALNNVYKNRDGNQYNVLNQIRNKHNNNNNDSKIFKT